MFRGNAPTRKSSVESVMPSNRDSIGSWLDVLTSMLSLPESERLQVRDELEDHLRSRVDDLLITGTDEQEAVRIAVAELGETAELAKVITHAHTRAHPRRRIMNMALIVTAVAGLSIGGYSLTNGSNGSTQIPALVTEVESSHSLGQDTTAELNLIDPDMRGVLEALADEFGMTLEVTTDAHDFMDLNGMMTAGSIFQGEFTLEEAMVQFKRFFKVERVGMKMSVTDSAISMVSEEELIRESIETHVHPVPEGISSAVSVFDYAQSLHRLLEVKFDLEHTRIEPVDKSIVVAAPPEIQEEILKMMYELNALLKVRLDEQRTNADRHRAERMEENRLNFEKANQAKAEREAKFEMAVVQIQKEFDEARVSLLESKRLLRECQNEHSMVLNGVGQQEHDGMEKATQRLMRLAGLLDDLELRVDENEERYTYLRTRLLDSQYANLFKGLD